MEQYICINYEYINHHRSYVFRVKLSFYKAHCVRVLFFFFVSNQNYSFHFEILM